MPHERYHHPFYPVDCDNHDPDTLKNKWKRDIFHHLLPITKIKNHKESRRSKRRKYDVFWTIDACHVKTDIVCTKANRCINKYTNVREMGKSSIFLHTEFLSFCLYVYHCKVDRDLIVRFGLYGAALSNRSIHPSLRSIYQFVSPLRLFYC